MSATAPVPRTRRLTGSDSSWDLETGTKSEVQDSVQFSHYNQSGAPKLSRLKPKGGRIWSHSSPYNTSAVVCPI
nr:unnamed protein product [Spirometra erinaceieuropaei]